MYNQAAYEFGANSCYIRELAVPGEEFGCPGYVRVCYCVRPETIEKSLPLFAKLI